MIFLCKKPSNKYLYILDYYIREALLDIIENTKLISKVLYVINLAL